MGALDASTARASSRAPTASKRKERGAVYTPPTLADWVADVMLRHLPRPNASVWDIACGDGALLTAVERRAPGKHRFVGIDIDADALAIASRRVPRGHFIVTNALRPQPGMTGVGGLRALAPEAQADAVVLNPPWGAKLDLRDADLREAGYQLARGQFDSYDLFVEAALGVIDAGGVAAFIVPDSLLQPEHEPLRRLLLTSTTVELIARLGEGFFPSVYRGTMVVVVRKGAPPRGHLVRCLRLTPHQRREILAARLTIGDAERRSAHSVEQQRFTRSPRARIDLDVTTRDARTLDRIEVSSRMPWREWLHSGRGVELSKHGWVVVCARCGHAIPKPREEKLVTCIRCKEPLDLPRALRQIVRQFDPGLRVPHGWAPLIAGADVQRYACRPSRLIRLGITGIAYKDPAQFAKRKLIVRKTGVGINVAIDSSGALTTQVVFHYVAKESASAPPFLLDYLAGVLNSRLMLAYHLSVHGDSEWRSHPYVTQRVIEGLPIPLPEPRDWRWEQAAAIAAAVGARGADAAPDAVADFEIERLVWGLFELTGSDCAWVLRVLDRAQSLRAIAPLRIPKSLAITPHRVGT